MAPLHSASSSNDLKTIEYLVKECKVSVNSKGQDGWTPAHFSGFMNNFDSLNLLIELGADLED